jgi:hypothetical protein
MAPESHALRHRVKQTDGVRVSVLCKKPAENPVEGNFTRARGALPERVSRGTSKTGVFVLDAEQRPLAPCHPARARRLLSAGKAAVWRRYPFTLILRDARPDAQPCRRPARATCGQRQAPSRGFLSARVPPSTAETATPTPTLTHTRTPTPDSARSGGPVLPRRERWGLLAAETMNALRKQAKVLRQKKAECQ